MAATTSKPPASHDQRHRSRDQIDTRPATLREIMRSPGFRAGFEEARRDLPPRFDDTLIADRWGHERGRQFAIHILRKHPDFKLYIPGKGRTKLSPRAIVEYEKVLALRFWSLRCGTIDA